MVTNIGLAFSLLQAVAVCAVAVLLWGVAASPLPESSLGLDFLLWPVITAAALALLVDLAFWLQGVTPLRSALHLPERYALGLVLALLMAQRLLRDASWVTLLLAVLFTLAATRAEPQVYYSALTAAGVALALLVALRVVSIRFPRIGVIIRFPGARLLVFGLVYLLLHQDWPTTYGFPSSPLLPALALALGFSYLGSTLGNLADALGGWANNSKLRWAIIERSLTLTATLASAASAALIAWGCISALPNVSAALLGHWPQLPLGHSTLPHFGQLFESRHLLAGLCLALVFARKLPAAMGNSSGSPIIPLIKVGGYGLSGCLAWMVAAKLSPLGHGYLLLGAAIASGLFGVALAHLLRCFTFAPGGMLESAARWLSESILRAFFLGGFVAVYGLLLRPLFYDMLWFAPIYEWLVVLAFALIVINRMRKRVRTEVTPDTAPPAAWPTWSRHVQTADERRDPRLAGLLALQQRFIDTGEWGQVWRYLLGLLLRNEAPLSSIPSVFTPMRRCHLASAGLDPWPGKEKRTRRRREAALAQTLATVEIVLALPATPPDGLDEARLLEVERPFLDEGAGPEALAVTLAAAYWQRGASLPSAAALWFPLLTWVDGNISGGGWRRISSLWPRARRWDRARRQRIMVGATAHLFWGGNHQGLLVAILAQQTTVQIGSGGSYRLPAGEAVEILWETESQCQLRPGESRQSYLAPAKLVRQPVLPGDYLAAEWEGITA